MATFLSKVFSRKKELTATRSPGHSLLEGKYEAVSPSVSPSAASFPATSAVQQDTSKEKERGREREKDSGFPLFKSRSRPMSPKPIAPKAPDAPHLTLNLPVPKEEKSRALGVVFEADPDDRSIVSDRVIGERRLNPLEALLLVKACSKAIVDRGGLETLGVMHPHWYSASPDVQRKLISLFIHSLSPKSPITTLSPTASSPSAIFNSELEYTRSPHDIAAVLRWALRHLRLIGDAFGKDTDPWKWYLAFAEAERTSSYPSSAFSELLVPQLPPAHLQLLAATLEIVSSLAAHSERNGISGSKLSKVLGLWLLTAQRSTSEDDWAAFYARWERAGRILEHLFLAQIRDEMARKKMPLRLQELVTGYPFYKDSLPEDGLLPRPRLSTRQYDALYVRIESKLPDFKATPPKMHPLRIIASAMRSEATSEANQYDNVWEAIKQTVTATGNSETTASDAASYPSFSRVFADETIRLLSLIPAEHSGSATPTMNLLSPLPRASRPTRRRSTSPSLPSHGKAFSSTTITTNSTSSDTPETPKDWLDFSSIGFGESTLGNDFAKTLLDSDVEKTQPPEVSRQSSKKRKDPSPARSRPSSMANPAASVGDTMPLSPKPLPSKCASINLTQLDEAFIDFWSDALLDPIASDWPSFVIGQLKPISGVEVAGRPISWLVLEHVFTRPPPPPEPQPVSPVTSHRASSPKPSLRSNVSAAGRKGAIFSINKRRFTLFSTTTPSNGDADAKITRKKVSKTPVIGELGEIVAEEPDSRTITRRGEPKGLGLSGVDVSAGGNASSPAKTTDLPPIPIVEAPSAEDDAASSSPIKTDEELSEKPTVIVPEAVSVPVDPPAATSSPESPADSKPLPPAPEPVVLTGETPGPQVALDTSEPATLAEVSSPSSPLSVIQTSAGVPAQEADQETTRIDASDHAQDSPVAPEVPPKDDLAGEAQTEAVTVSEGAAAEAAVETDVSGSQPPSVPDEVVSDPAFVTDAGAAAASVDEDSSAYSRDEHAVAEHSQESSEEVEVADVEPSSAHDPSLPEPEPEHETSETFDSPEAEREVADDLPEEERLAESATHVADDVHDDVSHQVADA
ncbi:hypothetical protein WOLCODRAFT_25634 [Wolfiporia cocos MD-104 SS10]|uniref:Meiotically up-regulated protein Msb1/Mug8 domain-containing protein n=1 Tax=Wolfiporia cocos (strain MD-104) TaxID=742152 RepID=A0A2H3JL66_WOLCO|nr:hypothetical protein WOLCODRAFT_25634 [Wolfiporia cocos MD-104 SS10]